MKKKLICAVLSALISASAVGNVSAQQKFLTENYSGEKEYRLLIDGYDYDGEVMWISPAEGEVSLAQYIYESIVLSLPYQRVHPEGECDADMLHRFRIVSQEEFSQIEHDAETRAAACEVFDMLDGDALAQLASLKEKLEGEKK